MKALPLLALLLVGCGVELEHGLDERQANELVATLDGAGIAADKVRDEAKRGLFTIVVGRGQMARAVGILHARDLPRRAAPGLAESFGSPGLLASPLEERARLTAALASDLERSLRELPGVAGARVHLAVGAEPLLGHEAPLATSAAVLLKIHHRLALSELDIQRLVSATVHGLLPKDVTVLLTQAKWDGEVHGIAHLGPIAIARESRTLAATLATLALVLLLLLALGLVFAAFRLGQLRRRLRQLEVSPPL